jgi:hypothetical protein
VTCNIGCTVERLRVESCGSAGINVYNGPALVRSNYVANNGGAGIAASGIVESNVSERNRLTGIIVNFGSVVRGNVSRYNGEDGFRCGPSTMIDNVAFGNTGFGVLVQGHSGLGHNVFRDNTAGTISAAAGLVIQFGPNLCGTVACP